VLSLAGFGYSLLSSAVVPALPAIGHSLSVTESDVSWLLTAYLLSAAVGTAILGRLGDMYGKQRMLVWTLVVLAAGTLLGALASSLAVLIAARVIQGAAGGIFPLSFGIVRDEFPPERVAGGIGLISAVLGIGGAVGVIAGGLIVAHLDWHWLFWIPLIVIGAAAVGTWRLVPESPVRVGGRVNWLAVLLMSTGVSSLLLAISEATTWGWASPRTLALLAAGFAICCAWVVVETSSPEPLIDMTMMRIRGAWTTNVSAFLLGAGMYSSFIIFPQFAQLPRSTGFGFGASVLLSGVYLLPSCIGVAIAGFAAGWIANQFGSKRALIVGSGVTASSFGLLAAFHGHPYDMLISAALLGVGIGLAFAALGNLIVQAVPLDQTSAAGGMNTVMRMVGGALGAQLAATLIAIHTEDGLPAVTGFTEAFMLGAGLLVVCTLSALLIPGGKARRASAQEIEPALTLIES